VGSFAEYRLKGEPDVNVGVLLKPNGRPLEQYEMDGHYLPHPSTEPSLD
jgi:hypothetical protein